MENELIIPWWASVDKKTFSPITAPLSGAWRLTGIWEYEKDRECWLVPSRELWGPADYLFGDTLTIHRPDDVKSMHYEFDLEKRCVTFDDKTYFISDLTDTELIMYPTHGLLKLTLVRIDPARIHPKTDEPQVDFSELKGLWWIDREYGIVDGTWRLTTDFRTKPGMYFWQMVYSSHLDEFEFGQLPKQHTSNTLNRQFFIIQLRQSLKKSQFFHPVKDKQGYWVCELDSMTGDYRNSTRKLHLTPIDPKTNDLFVKSLLWAESERHKTTAADKMPLELLRLWCISNPEKMANLIAENKFFEQASEYRSEEYAGVYAFLHHWLIFAKNIDPAQMADDYLKFQEILRIWLAFYDKGMTVKYVYPFVTKKYPEQLAKLRETSMSEKSSNIQHRLMTCELLGQKLTELRSSKHYLYALMEGLNKDEFYFCLYASEDAGKNNIKYSLKDFLTQYETFEPAEPVSMNFLVLRDDVNGTNYLSEWALFCKSKHRIFDFATGNLQDLFDEFLLYYCEKRMRNNKPFSLTPETIRHFGFTDEDVSELQPRIDNYNQETDNRLWSEYENLMRMDCIRKRVEANAKSVKN